MKFQVGDIVTGVQGRYSITNHQMLAAKVLSLPQRGIIEIRVLKHVRKSYIGSEFLVEAYWFKPLDTREIVSF